MAKLRMMVFSSVFSCILITGCSSSLKVRPMAAPDAEGVPYYLLRQDIAMETLGFGANGKITPNAGKKIVLITRPDVERGFRVKNDSSWFANSTFSIKRKLGGTIDSITGESKDQTVEAVTSLATIVGALIPLALAPPAAGSEEATLIGTESALIVDLNTLNSTAGPKEVRVKAIQESLALVRSRLAEIKKNKSVPKGANVSKIETLSPVIQADYASMSAHYSSPGNVITAGDVRVYLLPVDN